MPKIDSLSKTSANGVHALNGVTPDIPCGMKLHDWVEIGVFANGPSGRERDQQVLYLQRHHSPRQHRRSPRRWMPGRMRPVSIRATR